MANAEIKAEFFDFDGTLYDGKKQEMPASCVYALKKMREHGIKICLATGRHIDFLEDASKFFPNFDGYITMNGQAVFDSNRNLLYFKTLDDGDCIILKHMFKSKQFPIHLEYADKSIINYVDDTVRKANKAININIPRVREEFLDEPILMGVIYCSKREAEVLKGVFDLYQITQWNDFGYDLIDKNAGKESAIEPALEHWGLSTENAIAFGDSDNDLGMMDVCKYSVAMGNAIDECKEVATFTTTDIDDDGVYNACVHFGLIEG